MANPVYISHETRTGDGNITVPPGTTYVVAVCGNFDIATQTIGGVSMTKAVGVAARGCIFVLLNPPIGVQAVVMSASKFFCYFYLKHAGGYRDADTAPNSGGTAAMSLDGDASDMDIGFAGGGGGPPQIYLTGHLSNMTAVEGVQGANNDVYGYINCAGNPESVKSVNNGAGGTAISAGITVTYKLSAGGFLGFVND
jgi:hypothetical protein